MHQVLDIEICGRLKGNYARYEKWLGKWNPINKDEKIYYDYSNFKTKAGRIPNERTQNMGWYLH